MKADSDNSMNIDTSNMCSHLQKKLFEDDGVYHGLWTSMQEDPELTDKEDYTYYMFRKRIL